MVSELVDTARGPAQSYMFVRGDGAEVLGANGDGIKGWMQTLDHALKSTRNWTSYQFSGNDSKLKADMGARRPNAAMRQLYVKVAQEFLSERSEDELPTFITSVLSSGPSWVSLLRLYMKHGRLHE